MAATLYEPVEARRPAVLIAGGLGVTQRNYAAFAAWLAAQGHIVMSFDPSTQQRIAHAVGVATGAGYWRVWAPPSRGGARWLLYLAVPLLTPLFGYFPGKRLRMVGELPAAAMRQWARWCRHPEFAWGAEPDLVRASLAAARTDQRDT